MKQHYARNRCKQCYDRLASHCRRSGISLRDYPIDQGWVESNKDYRELLPIFSVPPKQDAGCRQCGQITDTGDRCIDCNPVAANGVLDFTNYRVCQQCREYKVHHSRGMCRTCYEQDLKNKRVALPLEKYRTATPVVHEPVQRLTISPPLQQYQSSKRSKSDVTSCVVCNSTLNEQTMWPGSIVCR